MVLAAGITWIDGAIIIGFFILTFWVGSYFHKWIKKPDDFYVAGRHLTPFILAATLAATSISLYNFQSYVGYAYKEGISIVWHEWTGLMALAFAGVFVLPILRRLRIVTIPELLGRRYSPALRGLIAILWVLRLSVWLGGVLYLSAQIGCVITGFSDVGPAYHIFIFVFSILTIAYTMAGGMWGVALTDVLQFVFLLGGALIMIPLIMHTVGYWHGMEEILARMGKSDLLTLVPRDGLWNWKGAIGIWLLGMQWAMTDQAMLQRAFSSNTVKSVAKGMVYAGVIMIPFAFIIPMPGIAAAIKVSQGTMPAFLEQDNALPMLLSSGMLPIGILGLILCGLFASQLSTIDSNLVSISTLVTLDIINPFRKERLSSKQTIIMLRIMIVVVGAIMLAMSYMAKAASSAIDLYISIISVVDLPLFVVAIVYGLFWKRSTPAGAITGYLTGMLLGLAIQLQSHLGPAVQDLVGGIYHLYSYIPILGDGVTIANANSWDTAVIGMIVTAVTVPLVSMFTRQSHPEKVKDIWQRKQVSDEERQHGEVFHIWPVSIQGRFYICLMFASLVIFLAGLTLGKYPAQEGYGISKMEIRKFEQAALLIAPEDLPAPITAESRKALFDDLATLAKNTDPTDDVRKPMADALVVLMKELMTSYCIVAQTNQDKYGNGYLAEFQERLAEAKTQSDCVIRENTRAGTIAVVSMIVFLLSALMRMRYD